MSTQNYTVNIDWDRPITRWLSNLDVWCPVAPFTNMD